MEILGCVIYDILMLLINYFTIVIEQRIHLYSISIFEDQLIKEKSILNIIYFRKNTFQNPRYKYIALGFIIAILLIFFGYITIAILYFTNAFEYNVLKMIVLTFCMFVMGIPVFFEILLYIKDRIYTKRERHMSQEKIEKIWMRIMKELPHFFDDEF